MSAQIVFNQIDLKELIFSYLFSFNKIIELDLVNVFHFHENNQQFMNLINEYTIDIASQYNSFNIIKWIYYHPI